MREKRRPLVFAQHIRTRFWYVNQFAVNLRSDECRDVGWKIAFSVMRRDDLAALKKHVFCRPVNAAG